MKTAREWAHATWGRYCGEVHGGTHCQGCDDNTTSIRAAQIDALFWACCLSTGTIEAKLAELEGEGATVKGDESR